MHPFKKKGYRSGRVAKATDDTESDILAAAREVLVGPKEPTVRPRLGIVFSYVNQIHGIRTNGGSKSLFSRSVNNSVSAVLLSLQRGANE